MQFLLLLVPLLHYGEGKCCPNFAVGVGIPMPFLLLLVLLLHYGEGKRCSNFAVGVCVAMPFLLLVQLIHHGEGKCCPNFRRWCRHSDAVFTAVDAAITLRRGQILLKYSPLV